MDVFSNFPQVFIEKWHSLKLFCNISFSTISWIFHCRMYPAAWENARFLDEEIIIQGYRIPPNVSQSARSSCGVVSCNNGVLCFFIIILSLNLVGYFPPLCLLFCLFLVIPAKEKKIYDGYRNVNHLEMNLESLFCYECHGGAYFTIFRQSLLLFASA